MKGINMTAETCCYLSGGQMYLKDFIVPWVTPVGNEALTLPFLVTHTINQPFKQLKLVSDSFPFTSENCTQTDDDDTACLIQPAQRSVDISEVNYTVCIIPDLLALCTGQLGLHEFSDVPLIFSRGTNHLIQGTFYYIVSMSLKCKPTFSPPTLTNSASVYGLLHFIHCTCVVIVHLL